jgi:hypothetical protein
MSYLETGKGRFTWISTIARTSLRPEAGCVQCGNSLEMPEYGKFNLTGRCINCASWISDEDEAFDELED